MVKKSFAFPGANVGGNAHSPAQDGAMTFPVQLDIRNKLLRRLSAADFNLLAPDLRFGVLDRTFLVVEADALIDTVYFPESGVSSTIAVSPDNLEVEVGLSGFDGCVPHEPILGLDRSVNRVIIQIAGEGWHIEREVLGRHLSSSATLRSLLGRFAAVVALQAQYTALSNAVHPIDERLARWLLMCDDRVDGGRLELTHDFLSIMLAVRRPSVTTALHVLEGNGFIRSERGCVIIRNRKGLEDFAHDAYGRPEAEYLRLMGPLAD